MELLEQFALGELEAFEALFRQQLVVHHGVLLPPTE
jgi:hypothetical protein